MKESPDQADHREPEVPHPGEQRLVLLMQEPPASTDRGDGLRLFEPLEALWTAKWLIIGVTALFAGLSLAYALVATEWYRAETLLMPAARRSTQGLSEQLADLSSLVSLAGINIGSGNSAAEPLAVLTSHDLTARFVEEKNLLPVFFAEKWDAKTGRWKSGDPRDWPDVRDAVRYFESHIRGTQEDKKTGLVTLSVEWTDPKLAAEWANALVERANERMRQRALADAESNVAYLQRELAGTSLVPLQQSVGRLLENELQTVMIARGSKEFAFRVIDRATPPKWRSWPLRARVVALSTAGGFMIVVLAVFLVHAARRSRPSFATKSPQSVP